MKRLLTLPLCAALVFAGAGFRGCNDATPEQRAQIKTAERKVREADNYINEGIRAGINAKRALRDSGKISAEEAVRVDEALIQMQRAADEFHDRVKRLKPGDAITDEVIAGWVQPVLTASQALKGLAFKSAEAKAAFDVATSSVGAGVEIYLSLKGSFK